MLCGATLPIRAPLIGQIVLRCSKQAGHKGRHSSPPPGNLPLSWPQGISPLITWQQAGRPAALPGSAWEQYL